MSFLDGYETVNQKVIRLHATYPTNRIETSIIDWNPEKGFILIECRIYRHYEDEKPAAIDYAHGMVGAYNVQMKRWYIEDTVSSAIGRCASVVLGTETKPSRESMEQVEVMPKSFVEDDPWSKPFGEDGFHTASSAIDDIKAKLGGELIAEALENAGINGFYVLNAPAHIIPVAGLIRREVMIDGITVIVCLDLDTSELLINNQPVNSFEVLA